MKRLLTSVLILILLFFPQFTFGSDLDEFKAVVETFTQAFNSMDADVIAQMTHPGLVVSEADDPFPNVYPNPDEFKEILQNWFSTVDSVKFININPQYKIVGNTGIFWCILESRIKQKGSSLNTGYERQTMTFVKSDGKWRVLMYHHSKFPIDQL